jgi:type I restriction enzyme S subunit
VVTRSGILRHSLPIAINTRAVAINQDLKALTPHDGIDAEFVAGQFRAEAQPILADCTKAGTTVDSIEFTKFKKRGFRLAPFAEQRRIVAKLNPLLDRTARARADLNHIPILTAKYKEALLAAAFSGDLTREWREAQHLAAPEEVTLAEVALDFAYGSSAKSKPSGEVPVLRMGNIQGGRLDWSDLVYTSDTVEIQKYRLQAGDVLFNRTNSPELVGKTALFNNHRAAIFAGYLIRVRCNERVIPAYLVYSLNSPAGREYCWRVKTDGVSQSNINARKLAEFAFPLPSPEEQREIVRRVDAAFVRFDTLTAEHARAAHLLLRLDELILARAFRGELVPQDTRDESASELLLRIRAATLNPPNRRRGHKPRSDIKSRAPRERADMTKSRYDDDVKNKPYLADLLRRMAGAVTVEDLFKYADLPLTDFYKQLKWEVDSGHIHDNKDQLEAA